MKTVRRRVLIREYDYAKKVSGPAGAVLYHGKILYHHSTFEPLSKQLIQQQIVWEELKSQRQTWLYFDLGRVPMLCSMKDWLYDPRYTKWKLTWDQDEYLCVQARSDAPVSRLGWAKFEYDPHKKTV